MVTLEANYSKKIGLPGYSSHQYMLTVRTELNDLSQIDSESRRLHLLLQTSVDRELQNPGWLPEPNSNGHHRNGNGNGNGNGHHRRFVNGTPNDDRWNCSEKQKKLILDIVDAHKLDKNEIENVAQARFGKGVRHLNKLEASGLLSELLEKYPLNQRQNTPAR